MFKWKLCRFLKFIFLLGTIKSFTFAFCLAFKRQMGRTSLFSPYLTLWFNVSCSQYLLVVLVVTKFANFNQATAAAPG